MSSVDAGHGDSSFWVWDDVVSRGGLGVVNSGWHGVDFVFGVCGILGSSGVVHLFS